MKAKGAKMKICPVCGKEFETNRSRKFCSDECFKLSRRDYNRQYDLKRKQAKAPTSERAGVDERLKSCHAAGQTYAEAQRAETIEKFARVEVPEAFQNITAETPEAPKPLTVYMDPAKITDEDLSKGGLGGHGPTVCIITPAEPEQPAERRRMSYLSKEQREALIKVETEAEILKEFFRSEGFDASEFPGNILERMAEQLKQLLEVAE